MEGGRVVVDEEVLAHLVSERLLERLEEALAHAASDDHRLRVDQVDGRGDPGAERRHRAFEQVGGELVVLLPGILPDAAREPLVALALHDLEQLGLGAVVVLAARPELHRLTARVGLHAAMPPAGAERATPPDDDMPDLGGCAAAEPLLPVEDQPAADAGAPEDSEHRPVRLAGAKLELGIGRHLDVVADRDRRPQSFLQIPGHRVGPLPVGQVARRSDVAGLLVDVSGRPDTDARQLRGLDLGLCRGVGQSARHLLDHVRRTALGRGLPASLAHDLVLGVHEDRLDLGSSEVDAAANT